MYEPSLAVLAFAKDDKTERLVRIRSASSLGFLWVYQGDIQGD